MRIIDISMQIKEDMLTYPNNPKPKLKQYSKIPKNATNETRIIIGSHTGTHVDAKYHVFKNGKKANKIPLDNFFGPCSVLDLTSSGSEITKEDLSKKTIHEGEIIILKTENSKKSYSKFRKDFAHLTMSAAKHLLQKKVKAVGIDYLSIKKYNADDDVHSLLINNTIVIEGLYLKGVRPGKYTFAGFPLKIALDGSPMRAVLIENRRKNKLR